ncbi:Peptidase S24-like protein [Phocaeicola vulgatus]|uniref:S24 family peptidase n=1 Tax=Phocaeicola vulgatus TaxID=821 RepID=UPI0020910290|nr:S24 family peptidase [Phocaeicola vulgatus]MCO5800620.1 Peptidase S24-like protein [Phocaeicola vulgatus]
MATLRQIIKNQGVTNKVVADALGIESTNIGRYDDLSKRKLSELITISKSLNMSLSELIQQSVSDDVELEEVTIINRPKYTEKVEENGELYLYDIEAAANLKSLLVNKDQNILGKISIPNIPKCDGAVYVKGDSMYPLLKSGDIIAYKEVPVEIQHIFYGEMYLVSIDIEGEEYLTVKYINQSERGCEWIKLVSYNQHHQPKDFPLSSVRALALVKLSIRMNTMK